MTAPSPLPRLALAALLLAALALPARAAARDGEAAFLATFREMVQTDTSAASGDCTALAAKIAARMTAAGFPAQDLYLFTPPDNPRAGGLVAVYPGADPKARAVLELGHIDVVNANREDWTRDPFTLIEEGGSFYGRGVSDMKAQDAIWVDTLFRFHQEAYRPRRTVKMALTCGEEGGFVNGARWLAQNRRALIDAGIAITEGAGGELDGDGRRLAVTVMAAEKSSVNFQLETTGPGGHASRPRPDNAIERMAEALVKVKALDFPAQLNAANRAYFTGMAEVVDAQTGAAMRAVLAAPGDAEANAVLNRSVAYRAMLRTTCIPTLIQGGHAPNAQPQRVRVTINCRTLPGVAPAEVGAAITRAIDDPGVSLVELEHRSAPTLALTPAVMGPIQAAARLAYPGLPVVAMQETFATDSNWLIDAGIPTYGVSGLFRGEDAGNMHGLNEHIAVRSVLDGRAFLYALVKGYAEAGDSVRARTARMKDRTQPVLTFTTVRDLEAYLSSEPADSKGFWLRLSKIGAPETTISKAEAIEAALCCGWIDGRLGTLDDHYFLVCMTPRRRGSRWSANNRATVERLTQQGRLRPAGLAQVQGAKADGRWAAAYASQGKAEIPQDLEAALAADEAAKRFFETLDRANRFTVIYRVNDAKRPETRAKRIAQYVGMLARGETIHPAKTTTGRS